MEKKKSEKANLDKNKGIFLQIGIVVAMALILIAFEWSSNPNANINDMTHVNDIEFEEQMIATRREEPKPPEAKLPEVKTVIEIVDDEFEVEDWE